MRKIAFSLLLFFCSLARVQANDSLALAQSYINLALTVEYFDSLSSDRVSRILPYLDGELKSISNKKFREENQVLLLLSEAHLQFLEAKHSFVNRKSVTRLQLLQWKAQLDSVNQGVEEINRVSTPRTWQDNEYYTLIGVTRENFSRLTRGANEMKDQLNTLINLDLYPDFKQIYFQAKDQKKYAFEELQKLAGLYGMSLEFSTLQLGNFKLKNTSIPNTIPPTTDYELSQSLHLISQFLQLEYIANHARSLKSTLDLYDALFVFESRINSQDSLEFNNSEYAFREDIPKDDFFRTEFSPEKIMSLRQKIERRFPLGEDLIEKEKRFISATMGSPRPSQSDKFYFPKVAPLPSSKIAIPNFLPTTERLGDVDIHVRRSFEEAGYRGRLHYYYLHEPGFAVTTAIERIQKNGSPVSPEDTRWDLRGNPNGSFSLYQVFRSIFFATESDFRLIACVVSAKEAITSDTASGMEVFIEMQKKSYSALPNDLRDVRMKDKTLTILVYHFFQSDIGQVPVLDQSKRLTVYQHLERTPTLRTLTAN